MNRTPASEVGGESVTTLPPWPHEASLTRASDKWQKNYVALPEFCVLSRPVVFKRGRWLLDAYL